MKKTMRKLISIMCLLFLTAPLISCGKKEEAKSPEEVLKTYIGAYLKSKDIDYKKVDLDKDKLDEIVNERDCNLSTIFEFTGESKEGDFLKALYSALNKVEYNIISSDVENDTAKVKIEFKGINLDAIKKDSYKSMLEEKKKKKMNVDEIKACYANSVIDKFNNVNLDESKTIEIELNKNSNKSWELTEDSLTKLESAITEKDSYERMKEDVPDSFKEIVKQNS